MDRIAWDGYLFSQPDSAFYFAQLQYDYAEKKGIQKHMAEALNVQAISFTLRGELIQAINLFKQSLKIQQEIGNKQAVASVSNNLGNVYRRQGNYAKAIDYQLKALKIREEIGKKKDISSSLNNIGGIYGDQGELTKSLDFFQRALKICEEIGYKKGTGSALNNMGEIYMKQQNYVKALELHMRSLKLKEESNDKRGIGFSLNNIGTIYEKLGEYEKALDFSTQSLRIREEIGDKLGIANCLNIIGRVHKQQGNLIQALDFQSKALSLAQSIDNLQLTRDIAQSLWKINQELGKDKIALDLLQLYVSSNDSLNNKENQKEVIRQEYKYNYEKEALADSIKNAEAQKVLDAQIEAQTAELERERIQRFALYGGVVLLLVFGGFIFNRYKQSQSQKMVIQQQKEIVEEAHKEITDSIQYAKRIQNAILPPNKLVKQYLPNSFILYKPKDVVAGDFYWLEQKDGKILFAAADCTGHGVPGAMVSVVCNNGLNRSVREYGLTDPGKILDKTREIVISEFEKSEDDVQDGMDIALCTLAGNTLQYAGAHNPLWIIRNGEVLETKANKQPIGKYENLLPYTTHTIELQKGDSIYLFSDGYVDQFGGEKEKKFKSVAFKKLLLSIQEKTMEEQREFINQAFETWRGDLEQIDDVCVIGVSI